MALAFWVVFLSIDLVPQAVGEIKELLPGYNLTYNMTVLVTPRSAKLCRIIMEKCDSLICGIKMSEKAVSINSYDNSC